jgi:hypothetical protein
MHLLKEEKQPLIDVFFFRKFLLQTLQNLLHCGFSITVFPDDGTQLVEVCREGGIFTDELTKRIS